MRDKDSRYILIFIFMFLGVVITVQFRSIMNNTKEKPSTAYEIENLMEELNSEKVIGSKLIEEIDFNLKKKESILKAFAGDTDDHSLASSWEEAKLYAGFTNVKGSGIILNLNDATEKNPIESSWSLIHDSDILEVVNELKRAGAQAISINNQRIISTTEIMCAGPTIRINRTRCAVPFEIKAIGDPKRLISSFKESEIYSVMKWLDIRVDIKEAGSIEIPKYSGNTDNLISGLEVINQ